MRLLLVKTSSLGDVLHTLPALGDALRALPDLRVDWVVEEAYAEIPGWHPAVAEVIPVALRRWRRAPWRQQVRAEWRACLERLRAPGYDLALDAQGLIKSALLLRQARAPRIGYDRRSAREGLASLACDRRVSVALENHAVERSRELFAAALGYPRPHSDADFGLGRRVEPQANAGHIMLLHGSARADKLWPESHWIELADLLAGEGLAPVLPWGDEAERARARRIVAQAPGATVLEAMNLRQLADCLRACAGVVAVDTGPGHLAAALGVPGVSLYGRSEPARVGTVGPRQAHLRGAPGDAAARMRSLQPARVLEALQAVMAP